MSDPGSKPTPLAQGDLAELPFAHLLLYVANKCLEGTLVVWQPQGDGSTLQDRIYVEQGTPARGRLARRASRLDRGLLPLFALESGPWAFYQDLDLVGDGEEVRKGRVEVWALIAASLRGRSRADAIDSVLAGLGDSPLRLVRGANVDRALLSPEEMGLVGLLQAAPASLAKLRQQSPLESRKVERLVYFLTLTKSVEVYDAAAAAASKSASRSVKSSRQLRRPERAAPAKKESLRAPKEVERGEFPPAPAGLSAKHLKRYEEIRDRSETLDQSTYFDVLKIARDVSKDKVQKAYFELVRIWHPDRLPSELSLLSSHVGEIFRHLTEAYETLSDDEKRGPYLSNVIEGGGTPESDRKLALIVGAAMEYRKVEVMLRRREYAEALAVLEELILISDDEPDYLASYAWAKYKRAPDDKALHGQLLAHLDKALAVSGKHERAHFYKGVILKGAGRTKEALNHFTRAAELNPRNVDAAREVRLASMRRSRFPAAKGDSLFSKIFGGKEK